MLRTFFIPFSPSVVPELTGVQECAGKCLEQGK